MTELPEQVQVSAPGKLMIAGEWAVLEPGNKALVVAVDKRVHVSLTPREDQVAKLHLQNFDTHLTVPLKDGSLLFDETPDSCNFLQAAVELCFRYFEEFFGFEIVTQSDELEIESDGVRHKLGFGSSAASTVAIVGAFFALKGYDLGCRDVREKVFKLAALAHYHAQGKVGSCFDVATSTFGGVLVYSRFDPEWLECELDYNSLKTIVDRKWPGLTIEPLQVPHELELLVGWAGRSANTKNMLSDFARWKKQNTAHCNELLQELAQAANRVIECWENQDRQGLLEAIHRNQALLTKLGNSTGLPIVTDKLELLSSIAKDAGGAGKLSGAGGGDCGVALCFEPSVRSVIASAWADAGIQPAHVALSNTGVTLQS